MSDDSGDRTDDATSSERDGSDTDGGVSDDRDAVDEKTTTGEAETPRSPGADETAESDGETGGAVAVDGQQLSALLIALGDDVAGQSEVDDSIGRALVEDTVEPESVDADEVVREHVAEVSPETVAGALAVLGDALVSTEGELAAERERAEELESRLRRKQAEFQNYKKRQKERLEEEKQRATEDLVERLLDVRDNLQRALEQDESADIRGGVESTLDQFDREFDREGVETIRPDPGDGVDPVRHEVLATVAADQPEDTIAGVHRPGYEMAGKVLRPAQVTVSEGADESGDAGEQGAETDSAPTE